MNKSLLLGIGILVILTGMLFASGIVLITYNFYVGIIIIFCGMILLYVLGILVGMDIKGRWEKK
jgi:hypothetical protein